MLTMILSKAAPQLIRPKVFFYNYITSNVWFCVYMWMLEKHISSHPHIILITQKTKYVNALISLTHKPVSSLNLVDFYDGMLFQHEQFQMVNHLGPLLSLNHHYQMFDLCILTRRIRDEMLLNNPYPVYYCKK